MADTQLAALAVANEASARDLLEQLRAIDTIDENVKIVDAVIATKNSRGHIALEQTADRGFLGGGLWGGAVGAIVGALIAGILGAFAVSLRGNLAGMDVGLIAGSLMAGFLGAIVGAIVGGLGAGIFSHFQDTGIDDDLMRKMARNVPAGEAALFLLFSGDWSQSDQALQGALRAHGIRYMDQSLPVSAAENADTAPPEAGDAAAVVDDGIAVEEDEVGPEDIEEDATADHPPAVADDVDTRPTENVDPTLAFLEHISQGSRDHGTRLSRLAGDLEVASQAMGERHLPLLAAIVSAKSRRLEDMAADTFLRGIPRAHGREMDVSSQQPDSSAAVKLDEATARDVVSKLAAERGTEISAAGKPAAPVPQGRPDTADRAAPQSR